MKHIYILCCTILLGISSCKNSNSEGTQGNDLPLAVCTTGMVGDMIKNIAGDKLEVISLMGPGVDPHLYKATQNDLKLLRDADMVFYNGLHLEGKMAEILERFGRQKTVVAIADHADSSRFLEDEEYPDIKDPHIWFDVELWASVIPGLADVLCKAVPAHCEDFQKNAETYSKELSELNEEVKSNIARIDESKRILVTAHDAFRYFGEAYNIEVRGLQGISTLSEFGLKDRVELVNYIVDKGIQSVFVESSVSPKNIEAIIEGCRQKGHQVRKGAPLFSDAMGEQGSPEGEYTGMVRSNVKHIIDGLKGRES